MLRDGDTLRPVPYHEYYRAELTPVAEALARAGWRLAVCTNKPEAASRALLHALALAPRFEAVAGATIEVWKAWLTGSWMT